MNGARRPGAPSLADRIPLPCPAALRGRLRHHLTPEDTPREAVIELGHSVGVPGLGHRSPAFLSSVLTSVAVTKLCLALLGWVGVGGMLFPGSLAAGVIQTPPGESLFWACPSESGSVAVPAPDPVLPPSSCWLSLTPGGPQGDQGRESSLKKAQTGGRFSGSVFCTV